MLAMMVLSLLGTVILISHNGRDKSNDKPKAPKPPVKPINWRKVGLVLASIVGIIILLICIPIAYDNISHASPTVCMLGLIAYVIAVKG